jgi:probable phosphoglycerate mutase
MGYVGGILQGNCETAVKVWFDGAARNNGSADTATSAGFGVCAMDPSGRVVFGGYGYLGPVSNNVAEFTAFAAACQWVAESGLASATVLGDSEVVADAFHGSKALHLPALPHLMVMAKAWLAQAGPVCVEHVPRCRNERADALANTAVDQQSSNMLLRDPLDWVVPPMCPPGCMGLFQI